MTAKIYAKHTKKILICPSIPSMVKKSNRKEHKDLRKAHKGKFLNALQCLTWFQNTPPLKRNFNALYGLKNTQTIKKKLQ